MSLIVFGSINLDLVATVSRLPIAGETLAGERLLKIPGGKGANQAVACARLGATTHLVGRLGNDDFGHQLLLTLQEAQVCTDGIHMDQNTPSGVALITVDAQGENSIIIIPGANACLDRRELEYLQSILPQATLFLTQLEVPLSLVQEAAEKVKQARISVILDPAPVPQNFPHALYGLVDIITPNEVEAAQLTGIAIEDRESATQAAYRFLEWGVKTAIVKLGDRGVVWANHEETGFLPAFPIRAVDTTAAGDAFNGALATALNEGLSLQEAIQWGSAAGAISATVIGTQPSLPDRQTLEHFLQEYD